MITMHTSEGTYKGRGVEMYAEYLRDSARNLQLEEAQRRGALR